LKNWRQIELRGTVLSVVENVAAEFLYNRGANTKARDRKRAAAGKCEGRKSWAEINPELVREAKRLRRRSPRAVNARCVIAC
jgi:hypothetical protein